MTSDASWEDATRRIATSLRPHGLDLVHPFRVGWWDREAPPAERLPEGDPDRLGVLVGNTRALWPHFVALLRKAGSAEPDPLDRWIEEVAGRVLATIETVRDVVFAHEPPPRRLPLQRLAERVGFAPLSPGRLLAHPVYGPWFALRAVVLLDVAGPGGEPPPIGPPCADCDAPCEAAFVRASESTRVVSDHDALVTSWRPWLAVREACPIGREHRYSDEQIRYHYARERPSASGVGFVSRR